MEYVKDLGPSAAVVVVVIYGMARAQQMVTAVLDFIGNHMAKNTEVLSKLCERMEAVETRVSDCHQVIGGQK